MFKRLGRVSAGVALGLISVLAINAPHISALATVDTWTGTDCNATIPNCKWSGVNNWSAGVPLAGYDLVFNSTTLTTDQTTVDDLVGLSVGNITFMNTSANYYQTKLTGSNALTVNGTITSNGQSSISMDLTLGANTTITGTKYLYINSPYLSLGANNLVVDGTVDVTSAVSGTGTITVNANKFASFNKSSIATTFSGNVVANGGLNQRGASVVSTASGVVVNGMGTMYLDVSSPNYSGAVTIDTPITLNGSGITGTYPAAALSIGSGDPTYGNATPSLTLTHLTLGADSTYSNYGNPDFVATVTGATLAGHQLTAFDGSLGKLSVNGTAVVANPKVITVDATTLTNYSYFNNTTSPLTVYSNSKLNVTVDFSTVGLTVEKYGVVELQDAGKVASVTVKSGGTLEGSGTTGVVNVLSGGIVAPGHSPGCLNTGNLTLNGTYQVQIGGTDPCTGYDQIKVTGTVDVNGATPDITLYNNFVPVIGQSYTIINNDGTDPVTGLFAGLAEGGTITNQGVTYSVTYKGGDGGNDVVLTVTAVNGSKLPGKPNTGLQLVSAHPMVSLGSSVIAAVLLYAASRRVKTARR